MTALASQVLAIDFCDQIFVISLSKSILRWNRAMRSTQITKIQFIAVLMLGLMTLGLTSCNNSTPATPASSKQPEPSKASPAINAPSSPAPSSSVLKISDLQKAPRQSAVAVQGKVGQQAAIVGGTVYELQDSSGSIWVLSRRAAPKTGEEISIRGILRYQSIPLNGKEQGSLYVEQGG